MRTLSMGRRAAIAAASLAGFFVLAGLASAAQFNLSMTRIHLGAKHPVETVTVGNQEPTPLDFEVHVQRWTQDDAGAWKLAPSDALVVHPLIVRIPAGGEARLRIGSLSPTVRSEEAYRVELQQLPDKAAVKAGTIRMLTKVSVPVFVQPAGAKPAIALSVASVDADGAHLVFRNDGTAYFAPEDVTVTALDAAGKTLHDTHLTTGYVLAGARWNAVAKLPAADCARVAKIEIRNGDAAPLRAEVAPGVRRCAR